MNLEQWLGKDNKLGQDIWRNKYQNGDETFDEWLDRVSGNDPAVRKLIEEKKFLFGGRILANRGLAKDGRKLTYSNCYVCSPPEDNIESIFDTAKAIARTYSYGGGVGIDIGKLSPRGARINNAAKETSGAVSFMDLYSLVTGLIGQSGRRGALMISIPCNHPDLEEFIDIKNDLDKVTKANISVRITDDFMQAVKNHEEFELSFVREETGERISKVVDAAGLFHKLCYNNWNMAEPGMLFFDRIENWNLVSEDPEFHYAGTNPCVSGDTLILTDKGYFKIKDLSDKQVNVWNGYEYSMVTPHITGHDVPMYDIKFSDGSELNCTHYHKFILSNDDRVEARNLKVGDKLIKNDFPVIDGSEQIDKSRAYTLGFFIGDGCIESAKNRKSIKLYKEKRKLINYIEYSNCNYCQSFDGEFLTLKDDELLDKKFVPDTKYSVDTRLNWLAGYIDSDGTLQSKDGGISISSIRRDVLLNVKHMLNTLGCNAHVNIMRPSGLRTMPKNDKDGNSQEYYCQESYRLTISATNVKRLMDLGLETHRVELIANPNRDASRFITVTDITEAGTCDTVYCFNEPKNHSGIFNGVITAQCAEEPLPAGGSCLLGSLNLSEFVTKDGCFDFNDFAYAVGIAVDGLTAVLDEGLPLHPLQEQRESVHDWRQIGLGIFGLADMLIKMGFTYGSPESIEICDTIGKVLADSAIRESAYLANEYSPYPKYSSDVVLASPWFKENATNATKDLVAECGLNNSQLLTCAPTGTLSTMLGVSGGIEPIFANYYTRKTESLKGHDEYYKVYTPIVKEYMDKHDIKDDKDLPEFFVTAQSIPYENRIKMQGIWQKHIDASISSTINLPNSATVEDVEDIYMKAWENGLKGVTIFRDGCARAGILTTSSDDDEKDEQKFTNSKDLPRGVILRADDNCVGKKRTLRTGCGTLHCEAFFDPDTGALLETYFSKGSTGGCNNFMVGLSRMISLCARGGIDIFSIVDQLRSSGACPSYAVRSATKHDTSKGSCCPVAIGNALLEMYEEFQSEIGNDEIENVTEFKANEKPIEVAKITIPQPKCPQCGGDLQFSGGCVACPSCGYSKCD